MRTDVKWGLILGVAVAVWTLALHLLGFYTTRIGAGLIADNVAIVLPIAAVTLALLERRRRTGSLTIGQAVLTGLVVGAVSAPISVGFLWIYHHFVNPQWVDYLVEHALISGTAKGQTPAEIQPAILNLRRGATDVAQITAGFVGSIVVCTLLGLIAGLILRRKPATAS